MPLYVRMLLATALPEEVEAAAPAHREHLGELRRQGKLRAAGEFTDGDGWLEIFEAADRLEADKIGRDTPLVERGLCSWFVREWVESERPGG